MSGSYRGESGYCIIEEYKAMSGVRKILVKAGLDKSHWGERIIAAEKRGRFAITNIFRTLLITTAPTIQPLP